MSRLSRLVGGLVASAAAALAFNGVNPVPEPGTVILVAGGLATLIFVARHRKKR